MLSLILQRHLRGFEVTCHYERGQKFYGKGTSIGLDEVLNLSVYNGKSTVAMKV